MTQPTNDSVELDEIFEPMVGDAWNSQITTAKQAIQTLIDKRVNEARIEERVKTIRPTQRVLLEALIDLFVHPPAEFGAAEDLHLHPWQIEKMLEMTDTQLAELDGETITTLQSNTSKGDSENE